MQTDLDKLHRILIYDKQLDSERLLYVINQIWLNLPSLHHIFVDSASDPYGEPHHLIVVCLRDQQIKHMKKCIQSENMHSNYILLCHIV